ncbi:MAG: hypothetical protein AAFU85_04205 [Planctomycetota bacterium]
MIFAYLGPGLGAGVVIVVIGVFLLLAMTLFTFLWFPLKRLVKRFSAKKNP